MTKGSITRGREIDGFSHRAAAWLAWSILAVCVVLIALGLALDFATDQSLIPFEPGERDAFIVTVLIGVLSLAYPAVGAVIASRLPTNHYVSPGYGVVLAASVPVSLPPALYGTALFGSIPVILGLALWSRKVAASEQRPRVIRIPEQQSSKYAGARSVTGRSPIPAPELRDQS